MSTLYCTSVILQSSATQFPPQVIPAVLVVLVLFSFIGVLVMNRVILKRVRKIASQTSNTNDIMQQALKIRENNVVRYDLRDQHIYTLYGHLLPDEGITEAEWREHVHPDDLALVLNRIGKITRGETHTAEFYYRWNFNFSGGQPRWGYLRNVSVAEHTKGISLPTGVISTLVDETELQRQQEEENALTGKYRLIFEQSIIGLSFYTPEGMLIDANKNMRKICHFDSDEGDAFFSKANLFDMPPFRDNVDRNHVEEFWVCAKSEIPERDIHTYLEVRLHPIHDEQGELVYIAIAARDVTEERQLYLQAKLNDLQIQKANEEIQRYEMELKYMLEACDMCAWRTDFQKRIIKFYKGLSTVEKEMTFDEFETYFLDDTGIIAENFEHPELHFTEPVAYLCRMKPLFHDTDEIQWNQLNNIPVFDDNGKLTGCFGLIRNMSRFIRAQEQLKRETERANDSGRMKSVFLANMTHEIRTPLNAIVGFSDLLQSMDAPEEKRELIHVIHNNCDMLLRLINDILAISAMDSNGLIISPTNVDFATAFNDICLSLSQRVETPSVQFINENPYSSLHTQIDIGRIEQVITNFVTNAIKYTHQGHIKVGYRMENGGLYIYCEDTGTGIPKEQCSKVFERFVKLNDYIQGTGLGLSICKAIAERCEGKIGVDSEVGQGSTFWIWIPCQVTEAVESND